MGVLGPVMVKFLRQHRMIAARCAIASVMLSISGCPVTQPQDTPVPPEKLSTTQGDAEYWIYVPSDYTPTRAYPLVVTLHGTHGWDSAKAQIREWRHLAETEGFLVVAPELRSVQGILPVAERLWGRDLRKDEQRILTVMDDVSRRYRVDGERVLLTGFSAGGYPMYFVGLRNPGRFSMIIARACNSSLEVFEALELTDRARAVPITIIWGKDDLRPIRNQSWDAVRWLCEHGFREVKYKKIRGGHLRCPDVAYARWKQRVPEVIPR